MNTKKFLALLTALILVLCSAALAEDNPPMKTGVYTIFNKTGENVTEVKLTDNVTGEFSIFPYPYDGSEEVFENEDLVVMYFDIPESEDGDHRLTLSYKTESGREESFGTLSIEKVNIDLLAADAMSGATPIVFSMEELEVAGMYTFYNLTGEVVTTLTLTDNEDGAEISTAFQDGFNPGESYTIEYVVPEERKDTTLTLRFETESGKSGSFTTLKIEEAPISLLDTDAVSGATPISFSAP